MLRSAILALSRGTRVRDAMVGFRPTRRVVQRFVAGEAQDDCIRAVRRITDQGLFASVDHLGEGTRTPEQASAALEEYLQLLGRLSDEGLTPRCEVSLKLTAVGLGLPDGRLRASENAHRVCTAAHAAGTTVTLDMEDHTRTDDTLAILGELRATYPETGGVLQAYLRRTSDDCARLDGPGSRIRLCKGAYDEPADLAFRKRADVDDSYLRCLGTLMRGQGYPMVASHDPKMIAAAFDYAEGAGRGPRTFEFQMLYGIRTDEQARLASLGHTVRVYVPYGSDWYGYFTRRLAERPANLLFFARALAGR